MKRIIIVDCPEEARDLQIKVVIFSKDSTFFRAEKNLKEFIPPDQNQVFKASGKYTVTYANGFIAGVNWFKSLLSCLLIAILLTSCAVYPDPPVEVWQPRHTGTYQECDTIINGDTLYYFKKL